MVDTRVSPLPPFSADELMDQTVSLVNDVEGIREAHAHLINDELTSEITVDISADMDIAITGWGGGFGMFGSSYGGCQKCGIYSAEFGNLKSEEEFEITKAKFVEHFNKKHRDILMKKGLPLAKKKFTKVKNGAYEAMFVPSLSIENFNQEYGMSFTRTVNTANVLTEPRVAGEVLGISTAYGVPMIVTDHTNSREPEYEVAPVVNPRNLDRNTRFREMLRSEHS